MSIIKNRDSNFKKLCKYFKKEYGNESYSTSYDELKKNLCSIMISKSKQNLLEDEKLKTQTEISKINHREYISDIALAISILSTAVSVLLNLELCVLGFLLAFIAVVGGIWASIYHEILIRRVLYYEFKLKCIEEVEQKKIKHVSVVKVCRHSQECPSTAADED